MVIMTQVMSTELQILIPILKGSNTFGQNYGGALHARLQKSFDDVMRVCVQYRRMITHKASESVYCTTKRR